MSEKNPLITQQPQQPPPGYKQNWSNYSGQQISETGGLDNLTLQKLAAVDNYGLYQGNALGEAISCGICANTYMITDRQRMVQVLGHEDQVETPLFLVQEESDFCARCCLCGKHPVLAKFHHALPPQAGQTICGCCYSGHVYLPDRQQPIAMTMERDGLCRKCIGCFICGEMCQSEAWVHAGDVQGKPGKVASNPATNANVIGRSHVPATCFTPTMDIMEGNMAKEQRFGRMEGPCFFGGCLDLCVDTEFVISSDGKEKSGDVGAIIKEAPKSCLSRCCQLHTDVDNYTVNLAAPNLTPVQKANILGTAVHVDYWFFQRDVRPIQHQHSGNGGVIIITCCLMYCRGCTIPIQVCIPYGKK